MLDLHIGDLVLVRGKGIISEAIERVENSCYSHVAGYVGHGELIEAEGLRRTGYARVSKYKGCADVFRYNNLTREQRWRILELATYSVGERYDWWLDFIEFMRYTFGVIVPYREPPNLRICSNLWAGIYSDTDIDLCPGIKYPTPKDVSGSKLLTYIGSF
ncbi:conserved hypothetical protein [Candidatus Desulfosporosinus infrequens]|uniref:Uncharacterized protein n=1 Tax=Candidatus Desulfosporosinus infrequens TaxID=2043169 RepID=A0A2U3LH72_9FIRM|nr:conserved hypothetical protein [Candidatus Desulfosporosinus infrequens]